MDATHLHLLSNHIPVIVPILGAMILLIGLLLRRPDVVRVALGLFVLGALGAAVTYSTGEPAEERVEHMAGISEAALEAHEDAAAGALTGNLALGAAALALLAWSLWRREPRVDAAGQIVPGPRAVPRLAASGVLAVALLTSGWTAYAASLGGQIRHTEIASATLPAGQDAEGDEADGGDDDEAEDRDRPRSATTRPDRPAAGDTPALDTTRRAPTGDRAADDGHDEDDDARLE